MNIDICIANYLSPATPRHFSISTRSDASSNKLTFNDLAPQQEQGISVLDRALNYGDGCFTTMYYEHGSMFILERHLLRLEQDANRLGIVVCIKSVKYWLLQACSNLFTHANQASVIKILVSRGVGGRGYEPPETTVPKIIISFYPTTKLNIALKDLNAYKFSVQIANMQLSTQPLLAGIKHVSRLEQVLAKQELQHLKCDDLLLCNQNGHVVEGTASNLFIFKNGIWITPNLIDCGVDGVMRNNILEFMKENKINHEVKRMKLEDLFDAESIFLCNAIKFIVPVSSVSSQSKKIDFNTSPSFMMLSNIYKSIDRYKIYQAEANS